MLNTAKNTVLALVLCLAPCAMAQSNTGSDQQHAQMKQKLSDLKTACQNDINKLCTDVQGGDGRLMACLKSKEDQLSPGCRSARQNMASYMSQKMDKMELAVRKNCGSDIQKFCSEVPSGGGRIMDCLNDHQSDLSQSCKGLQAKMKQKMSESTG